MNTLSRFITRTAIGILGVSALGGLAWGQMIFGLGEFPGGTLHVAYEIIRIEDGEKVYSTYTLDIFPNPDGTYTSRETFEAPNQELEELTTGMRRAAQAAVAGARYEEEERADIDLSPLQTLEEKGVQVRPHQNYYLPDGARLVTGELSEIAGIQVVMGTYLHPGYPNQRVILAFAADPEVADLLPMLPLMVREINGEEDIRTQLIEFSYSPTG
ncbi:MAG: hypothetical protein XD60_0434 [Acetothermia bacterium 64_32]|nr:MAG: hypothetical protein XD60_0434 [Acetothermia bacterium 64_32]HAF71001.1 hypothetical protein [Candidatus Acetothermia bacterium]